MRSLAPALLIAVLLVPFAAQAGVKKFDHPRFSFEFTYDASWIPRINTDGESVTFAREAGEILISIERARNPQRHETADAFAQALKKGLKERIVFDKLTTRAARLGGSPAVLVAGTGKLFEDSPYRAAVYVCERDGRFYVVKFTGLYERTGKDFPLFEALVRSIRFKEKKAR